jgi:hypothetical protein
VSRRRDESRAAAEGGLAGVGVAGAGVEAHAGAAREGDGEPFVRTGVRFEGCCCAHGDVDLMV